MPNSTKAVYISGDTVYYEGVAEVARRFNIELAILFMGAAKVPEVGPDHLTFTAEEGVKAAHLFPDAGIIPLHWNFMMRNRYTRHFQLESR